MTNILYEIRALKHRYQTGKLCVEALRGLDMDIYSGKLTCISGPSGSGKSTLLHLLALIESKQEGSLLYHNQDLSLLSETQKNHLRRYEIGLIFQQFYLFPVLTAQENVAYFLHRQSLPPSERRERTQHALKQVELWEYRDKRPCELSGGQQQRVAIARALAKKPKVIIADEPTASLDQKTGQHIMNTLTKVCHEDGVSIIIASHDAMVHERCDIHWSIRDGLAAQQR